MFRESRLLIEGLKMSKARTATSKVGITFLRPLALIAVMVQFCACIAKDHPAPGDHYVNRHGSLMDFRDTGFIKWARVGMREPHYLPTDSGYHAVEYFTASGYKDPIARHLDLQLREISPLELETSWRYEGEVGKDTFHYLPENPVQCFNSLKMEISYSEDGYGWTLVSSQLEGHGRDTQYDLTLAQQAYLLACAQVDFGTIGSHRSDHKLTIYGDSVIVREFRTGLLPQYLMGLANHMDSLQRSEGIASPEGE